MAKIIRTQKKTNHSRKHPTATEIRQASAEIRKAQRALRTNAQQIERLNQAFGVNQGAAKERARLVK